MTLQPQDGMPLLEMRGVTVTFPGVVANDDISIELYPGEILALLGENGAGKTTLMNVLYGLYRADSGEVYVRGRLAKIQSPSDAIRLGIGMVHQHFMLIPPFTVAENIVLGTEPVRGAGMLDMSRAVRDVKETSERYGLAVEPHARVERISVGMQQRVEILKALYRGAEVLILDEPTAVLTPQEVVELAAIMRNLVSQGKSVIFITHKLKEVMAVSDRVTTLRRGKVVGTVPTRETTPEALARMMVGRDVVLSVEKRPKEPGDVMLKVEDLQVKSARGLAAVRGVSFEVRSGEIVGIAGIEGNGQTELVEALTGLRRVTSGRLSVTGRDLTGRPPRSFIENRVAHIPEDRQNRGLILGFSVAENLVLECYYRPPFAKGLRLDSGEVRAYARRLISDFDVRTPDENVGVGLLSGGNQQKVIVARELSLEPLLLIASQPTRGLDVGAIEFVHRRLVTQRDEGKAILLVSLELDEIMSLADRILVLYEGRIAGEMMGGEATEEEIGFLMAGGRRSSGGVAKGGGRVERFGAEREGIAGAGHPAPA